MRRLFLAFCLLLSAITVVWAFPPGTESLLAGKVRPPVPPVTVLSVGLSPLTFTAGGSGTVGTLSAILSTGSPTGSFTLKNSGNDHSGISCNNYSSYLSVSGTSLNFNSSAPVQSYPGTCITYTQNLLGNSPYTQAFTLTGNPAGQSVTCTNPTPPHPAQVAGLTTLLGCWDFTQPQFSNISTWLGNCGGPSNATWWAVLQFRYDPPFHCSDYTMTTDPLGSGSQVFHMQWTPADYVSANSRTDICNSQACMNAFQSFGPGGAGAFFHYAVYAELTMYTPTASSNQSSANNQGLMGPWYWYTWMIGPWPPAGPGVPSSCAGNPSGSCYYVEWDWVEWFIGQQNGQIYSQACCINDAHAGPGTGVYGSAFQNYLWFNNQEQYNTLGFLQNEDSSFNQTFCTYVNGTTIDQSGSPGGNYTTCAIPGVQSGDPNLPGWDEGANNHGLNIALGSTGLPNITTNIYIKSFRVWGCPTGGGSYNGTTSKTCFDTAYHTPP